MRKMVISLVLLFAFLLGAKPEMDIMGNSDPAMPCQIARLMTFDEIKTAIYEGADAGKGARAAQLAAIDAAACIEAPFDMLPYLAALMGARDRQVAARSASALFKQIENITQKPTGASEIIPAQAKALSEQLLTVGKDPRLDLDIRISALESIKMIKRAMSLKEPDCSFGLEDEEPVIRAVVLAGLGVPIDKEKLGAVAQMATGDPDPDLRGQASALLCENALAHGVAEPSSDLKKILMSVLSDGNTKAKSIGSVLGCLKRFPAEVRGDFVDQALSHSDPAVAEYWKSLE